ncbi:TRAP transporter large permease [Hornefia butyriciproducens]|uniref:TRAP transporter large permease n=1 Tax=Hornefia butyriciproducens TaxID=2652293 RepID=UPI0023F4C730|nr:TRAP transporter large permease [Hornefia butyriciproducens]MDD6298745.1 TRAP transporter large permease [Hornefia butyriciproducens]
MTAGITFAIIGVAALIILVVMGVHIGVALGAVGFFGLAACLGPRQAIAMVGLVGYNNIATFDYAVIPLFIMMGMLATAVGISTQSYDCLAKWLGKVPGGLGVATTLGCAAFGTMNGSPLVTASVFGKIAGPEMTKYGYDKYLTYGMISASGNIGQLIPPSILIVIYGALSGDSIGRLLMAGISPGIALTIGFSAFTVITAIVRPHLFPKVTAKYSMREKIRSLKDLVPIVVVAIIIIGGIFTGVFSSAEAGAIGCLVFFVYGFLVRVPLEKLKTAVIDTVENAAMLFLILACSSMFAKFMTVSGLAEAVTTLVTTSNLSSVLFLFGTVVVLFILGCFMDAYSSIALTIPIFYPAAVALGIDPIHFDIVAIIALHMGGLTPPVGLCVYSAKSVAPDDVDVMGIFKGAFPYLIVMIIIEIIYIFVPSLSLAIPNAMFN